MDLHAQKSWLYRVDTAHFPVYSFAKSSTDWLNGMSEQGWELFALQVEGAESGGYDPEGGSDIRKVIACFRRMRTGEYGDSA